MSERIFKVHQRRAKGGRGRKRNRAGGCLTILGHTRDNCHLDKNRKQGYTICNPLHILHPVDDELYDSAIRLFSLLAHPARLRILDLLRRGEACVCHLQAALRVPQPYVSQQLRVLREAGLISQRREGLYIYYRLADPQVERLLAEVLGPVEEISPFPECTCPRCQKTSLAEPIFLVEVN